MSLIVCNVSLSKDRLAINLIFLFLTCVSCCCLSYWACIVVFEERPSNNTPTHHCCIPCVVTVCCCLQYCCHCCVVIVVSSVNFGERLGSSTPVHYRSIRCSGEEDRLTDCPGISTGTASCSHTQDAYIVCRPSSGRISCKLHQVFCTSCPWDILPVILLVFTYSFTIVLLSSIPHSTVTSKLLFETLHCSTPLF